MFRFASAICRPAWRVTGMSAARAGPGSMVAIGVAGAGRIAERVHFQVLATLPGVRVTAIAEPSAIRATVAAKYFPQAEIVPDVGTLLTQCSIDALIVCSPPATHAAAAQAALAASRHVYVEKPIAVNTVDARQLVAFAQSSGCIAMAGFNYRRHPLIEKLRQELQVGRIGQPVVMRSVFSVAHAHVAGWQVSPATGGGALLELGSHHFDLARFLFDDEVADVSARVWGRHRDADTATVEFRMKRGVHGTAIFAIGATDDDRLEVLGEDGAARLDRMRAELSFGPQQFEYGRRHVLARELRTAGGALRRLLKRGGESSYGNSLAAFVAAVRTGVPVRPDLSDGLRNLEWIEAAMQSAASGTRVSVSPANGAAA